MHHTTMSQKSSSQIPLPKRVRITGTDSFYYAENGEIILSDEEINAAISSVPDKEDDSDESQNGSIMKDKEQDQLEELLKTWNVVSLYPKLAEYGFNIDNIRLIKESHLHNIFADEKKLFAQTLQFLDCHSKWLGNTGINTQGKNSDDLDVNEIIQRDGADIVQHHRIHGDFTDDHRRKVAQIIVVVAIDRNIKLPPLKMYKIAEEICKVFPLEDKTVYYDKKRGQPPTGYLHQYYYAKLASHRQQKDTKSRKKTTDDPANLLNDEVKKSINFLNTTIDNAGIDDHEFSAELIFQHWQTTFEYRKSHIEISKNSADVIALWPHLKKSYGHLLIESDFSRIYGEDVTDSLVCKWNSFFDVNLPSIIEMLKKKGAGRSLMQAEEEGVPNKKNIAIAFAIHDLFPPATFTTNKRWMPATKDGKDSCIKLISGYSNIDKELLATQDVCQKKAIPLHPMLFVIVKQLNPLNNSFQDVEECVMAFGEIFKRITRNVRYI